MMDLLDYTLEPLHEDGQLILYRAVHAGPADAVTRSGPDAGVLVVVQDAGLGFERASLDQLFEPLYTTKPDGLAWECR
jgi:signal transduction histidine kinase